MRTAAAPDERPASDLTAKARIATALRVPLAIGPGQDIRHVESVLLAAASHADVHADPKPEVVITGMSASAVSLELWVWYDGQSFARVDVANRVYHAAFDALAAAGIKMGS